MNINEYFKELEDKVKVVYSVAEQARKRGLDPRSVVEIPLAKSLAERVVGLISTIYPQINNPQIVNRILELEKQYGNLDPGVCLKIAEETAKEKFCKFQNLEEGIDAGIRVAFGYLTLGVVAAPLEGYTHFKLKKTKSGEDYFAAYFSGPIGGAGRTAASISLLIIDYLRESFGYAKYDPTEKEIKRCVTELYDFHERITNLQYLPTEKEIEFLVRNIPIQIGGDPSHDKEVSNHRDLERVETNFIRSGFCLILGEGIAQKAPKALAALKKLREQGFKLSDWDFLEEFCNLQKKLRDVKKSETASATYIQDLVAGRPVYGHPSRSGTFRLRYGRARNSGYSCLAVHPATMRVSDNFIAIGTQLKTERPTKGGVMASCDSIDGPIVKLRNGSVKKIKDVKDVKYEEIKEIIYLGDMLVPYGDFRNRNSQLFPAGYVEQYWFQELKKKVEEKNTDVDLESIYEIGFNTAVELSRMFGVALHPNFIFYWSQISKESFLALLDWLQAGRISGKLILPWDKNSQERFKKGKRALELLGVEHEVATENVVLDEENSKAFLANLGLDSRLLGKENYSIEEEINHISKEIKDFGEEVLKLINKISNFEIKDKAGSFIGARMGRPEKAKLRKLVGSPNVLFPVGYEGGRLRSVNEAVEVGNIKADFPVYFCEKCGKEGIYFICEKCGEECKPLNYCPECGQKFKSEKCKEHNKGQKFMSRRIDSKHYFEAAVKKLKLEPEEIPVLVKGVRGTSNKNHVPENLAKGLLRSLFGLNVNKDGTIRFDATEMPLTHFKPAEIMASIEKLRELGYKKDIYGKELTNENQVLEIKPHDIILPACPDSKDEKADGVFINVANFIDSLLVRFYGLKAFYNVRKKEDLIGHLIACIAPHNCACVVGRIIGFSKTQGLLASPYIHAACRRDCLGFDSYVPIKKNGKWEISKIGELIESLNPIGKADNFGTLKKEVDFSTFGNPGEEKVREITKHSPRNILKIYLEDGRKLEVTESHKVYLKGKKEKRANELEIGDKLIVSYKKNIQEEDVEEIFLPEIFQDREDIMLRNIRDFLNSFENLSKHTNFYQRDSFPIKFVKDFLRKHGKDLKDLPSRIKISIKRDNIYIPIRISLDKELLKVIGLYIAGGYAKKNESKKGFYQVYISSQDKEILSFVKTVFFSHFGLKPSEDHIDHVTFSSRIIYEFFKNYLKTGERAKNKRIPSLFLNLRKEKLAALLKGYFEGDGNVSLSDARVTCDSVSEGLKQDLSFVLSRFNIFTKFYEYEKEPGPKVRQFYLRKNRTVPKFKITKIIIPSNFVRNFKEIGFLSERKNKILEEVYKKNIRGMKIDFDEDYVYTKIKKIEEIGEAKSYCFNVLPEHNFFSNDILVKNCDGDEMAVMLLMDLLLNFSREFLPAHRGGTQDAPLVLNARIRAGEVDDMIFDVDVCEELPLELYEAAEKFSSPYEVKVEQIKSRLGGNKEFSDLHYEYEVSNINSGVLCSSYKTLGTMQEKVQRQMELVTKLRGVDTGDVARLIIDRHFMRDIRGNLRKFSQQQFRCSSCNEKYRRPPLSGICKCGGNIIFTISEGGIVKYLEPALSLAENYDVPEYIKQSLDLTKSYVESIFGREKEKQEALKSWF